MDLNLPPPSSFDACIFDCDGTLVDSMPMHYEAWVWALKRSGATFEFTVDDHHSFAGMAIPHTVLRLNEIHGTNLDPIAVDRDRRTYVRAHLGDVAPIEPVVAEARRWNGQKPLAVASGSDAEVVEAELRAHRLRELFEIVITPADVGRGKPDPDMFLLAAERMGIEPSRCLVFEDGENGILAAKAAGMPYVFVPTPERAPG